MDLDSFYDERTLFLIENKLNYAVDQQGFSSGFLQIQESMLMNNFVTAHQQPNHATNIPEDENVSREEATQAFKTRVTNLLNTPKTRITRRSSCPKRNDNLSGQERGATK